MFDSHARPAGPQWRAGTSADRDAARSMSAMVRPFRRPCQRSCSSAGPDRRAARRDGACDRLGRGGRGAGGATGDRRGRSPAGGACGLRRRLAAGEPGSWHARGRAALPAAGEIQDLDILAGGGIGQQRHAPAAVAVADHRADRQARRQQPAIAGGDHLVARHAGRSATQCPARHRRVVAGHDRLDVAGRRW